MVVNCKNIVNFRSEERKKQTAIAIFFVFILFYFIFSQFYFILFFHNLSSNMCERDPCYISLRRTIVFANVCVNCDYARNLESRYWIFILSNRAGLVSRTLQSVAYRSRVGVRRPVERDGSPRLSRMIHPLLCQKASNLPPVAPLSPFFPPRD